MFSLPNPGIGFLFGKDLLDPNPGRPGAPVSIPSYPIETSSSGIKAPQYFAPGTAGDWSAREKITANRLLSLSPWDGYLVPNNFSANAHGNGYADPNLLIPEVLESVQIDGGAFNHSEGNHSVNLAATYGLRSRLDPVLTMIGDSRDLDLVAGIRPTPESWMVFEGSLGNGLLDRLEHRPQYKGNAQRLFRVGEHRITRLGIGYYGQSYVPGLVPLFAPNPGDANFPNLGDAIDRGKGSRPIRRQWR